MTAPAPAPAPLSTAKVLRLDVREVRLDNGLTVLLCPDRGAPVFTIMLWVPAGTRTEPPGKSGISHYLEHCYSMGSSKLGPREIDRFVKRRGGHKNAFTYYDYTGYHESLPIDALEDMIEIEADRLATLALPADRLASELEVVKEERRQRTESSPDGLLYERLMATAFTRHPYRLPVIGTADDLLTFTRDDALAYYRAHYVPANIAYVVAGDLDPDRTADLFRKHFGAIAPGERPRFEVPEEPPQAGERRFIMRKESVRLPRLAVAYLTVGLDHADYPALTVLEMVLSGGESARFPRILRRERKLVTYASASQSGLRDPAPFFFEAEPQPGVLVETVEAAIDDLIADMAANGPTPDEVERAKRLIAVSVLAGLEPTDAKARAIGRYHTVCGRGWPGLLDYLARLEAVEPDEVRRAAAAYLVPERRTVGIQLPPDAPEPARARAAAGAVPAGSTAPHPTAPAFHRTPPPSGDALPGEPFGRHARRLALPNGLTVVYQRTTKVPTVALEVAVRAGSAYDLPGKAGLANLVALSLRTGTARRDEESLARAVASLGASLRVDRGADWAFLSTTVLASDLERGLELLAEVAREPAFADDKVARVRREVLASKASERAEPEVLAAEAFYRELYDGHPYSWPTSGTTRAVAALTPEDARAFHDACYTPSRIVVAAAGEMDADRFVRAVERLFGDAGGNGRGRGTGVAEDGVAEPPAPRREREKGPSVVLVDKPDQTQAFVRLGDLALARGDGDFDALLLGNYILGGAGLVSRISQEVRTRRGLAYTAYSALIERRKRAPFVAYTFTKNESAAGAVEVIIAEVERLRREPVPDDELAGAKSQFAGSLPFKLETNAQKAWAGLTALIYGLGPDHLERQIERLRAFTAEDVRRAAERHLNPASPLIVAVAPRALAPAFERFGPVRVIDALTEE